MIHGVFMRPQEIADATGVHSTTIRRHIKAGLLTATQIGGRLHVHLDDLKMYLGEKFYNETIGKGGNGRNSEK